MGSGGHRAEGDASEDEEPGVHTRHAPQAIMQVRMRSLGGILAMPPGYNASKDEEPGGHTRHRA